MNPNARPDLALPGGRAAVDVFGPEVVDRAWERLLVPRPDDDAEVIATALGMLAAADVIPPEPEPDGFDTLARTAWSARLAQQASWPAEGWALDRVATRLHAHGIAAEWALLAESDADAVDALDPDRLEGSRGAVFLTERQAMALAVEPGDAHVGTHGFVAPRRHGFLGRAEVDLDEYRTACEAVSGELVAAARAEGVDAEWDGDWERPVVLRGVQVVARLP